MAEAVPVDLKHLYDAAPAISRARELSAQRIDEARSELANFCGQSLDVVGFGSLARQEVTTESDFDYLVLATGVPESAQVVQRLLSAADHLRHTWSIEQGSEDRPPVAKPGTSGVFGRAVGAFDLVERIGLEEDTNHSLTRRMLLLEESVSLCDSSVHEQVLRAALERYLYVDKAVADKVPRFLLNDVVRYWRTITVDYQAKARSGPQESGLRYLKLIIARKILFAGTAMSLLLCGKPQGHRTTTDDLSAQFAMPPLDRLVQLHDHAQTPADIRSAMTGVIEVANTFLEASGNSKWRETVKAAQRGVEPRCEEFEHMREVGNDLQTHLETIFFEWDLIGDDSRRMLVF